MKIKPLAAKPNHLLDHATPDVEGKTWIAVIAEAVLRRNHKGGLRVVAKLRTGLRVSSSNRFSWT